MASDSTSLSGANAAALQNKQTGKCRKGLNVGILQQSMPAWACTRNQATGALVNFAGLRTACEHRGKCPSENPVGSGMNVPGALGLHNEVQLLDTGVHAGGFYQSEILSSSCDWMSIGPLI